MTFKSKALERFPYFMPPFVHIDNYDFDNQVVSLLDKKVAKEENIVIMDKFDKLITLAMDNPLNLALLDKLEKDLICKILPIQATKQAIHRAIERYYE